MLQLFKKILILTCFVRFSCNYAAENENDKKIGNAFDLEGLAELIQNNKNLITTNMNDIEERANELIKWDINYYLSYQIDNLNELLQNCGISDEKKRNKMLFLYDQLVSEKPTIEISNEDATTAIIEWFKFYTWGSMSKLPKKGTKDKLENLLKKYNISQDEVRDQEGGKESSLSWTIKNIFKDLKEESEEEKPEIFSDSFLEEQENKDNNNIQNKPEKTKNPHPILNTLCHYWKPIALGTSIIAIGFIGLLIFRKTYFYNIKLFFRDALKRTVLLKNLLPQPASSYA